MLSVFTPCSNWSCLKLARTKSSPGKYASLTQAVCRLTGVHSATCVYDGPRAVLSHSLLLECPGPAQIWPCSRVQARWLYCRAAAGPGWHRCWIWQHRNKGLRLPPGKAGPHGWGRGCWNLFHELAAAQFFPQSKQVAGEGSMSRRVFLVCALPCRHQQPEAFLHVQMALDAHKAFVPSKTQTDTFSEGSASSQQKRGGSKNRFLFAKCHFDGTDIFSKASINFNVLFCLF